MRSVLSLLLLITLSIATTGLQMNFIILPGNGGCGKDILSANWYGWFKSQVEGNGLGQVIAKNFPDPYVAKESVWLPFVKEEIERIDDLSNTILIGHSSGALATMRLAEQTPGLKGIILVGVAHTDLGDENERASGYFDRPWDWQAMVDNVELIHIFHSEDDHLIPVREARFVATSLTEAAASASSQVKYDELNDQGHFFGPWNELMEVVVDRFTEPDKGL
jgi:uncharacterized protein